MGQCTGRPTKGTGTFKVHMRYDTPIIFRKQTRTYDATTGNYNVSNTDTTVYASVDGTRQTVQTLVYGGVMQGSITVQLQNHYDDEYDQIVVNGKPYKVDYRDPKRVKDVFVLTRV